MYVCMCVCVYVCVYVCPSRPKIAKLFFVTASERAKHAVSFQIIKYIIQKNITTSWAPKYSVPPHGTGPCASMRMMNGKKDEIERGL